jgi:hypothetical protein
MCARNPALSFFAPHSPSVVDTSSPSGPATAQTTRSSLRPRKQLQELLAEFSSHPSETSSLSSTFVTRCIPLAHPSIRSPPSHCFAPSVFSSPISVWLQNHPMPPSSPTPVSTGDSSDWFAGSSTVTGVQPVSVSLSLSSPTVGQ